MKRAAALLTCIVLASGLSACTSGGGTDGTGSASSTPTDSGNASPSGSAGSAGASASSGSASASGSGGASGGSASGSSATGSDPSASGSASGDSGVEAADATIASMLAMVPTSIAGDPATDTGVMINLYWKAAAAGGLTVPDDPTDADAQAQYAMDLTSRTDKHLGVAGTDLLQQLGSPVSSAGQPIALSDVAADVQAGQPPHVAVAARGNFDTSAIDTAFRNNTDWKDELTTPDYHGHTFYRWMDDLKMDVTKRYTGLFTDLGQSRRIALPDASTFLYSRDDATMHALLDAGDDPASVSLAGDDEHLAVATALDEHDVYSALIIGQQLLAPLVTSSNLSPEQAKKVIAVMREHALKPYLLAGIGETLVGGSPRTVIVLANADADAAEANAEALRGLITDGQSMQSQRPWSDFFGIDSVSTDGSLTIGVLTLTDPARVTAWYQAVMNRDTLLAAG
jgi:hypothetical protein